MTPQPRQGSLRSFHDEDEHDPAIGWLAPDVRGRASAPGEGRVVIGRDLDRMELADGLSHGMAD